MSLLLPKRLAAAGTPLIGRTGPCSILPGAVAVLPGRRRIYRTRGGAAPFPDPTKYYKVKVEHWWDEGCPGSPSYTEHVCILGANLPEFGVCAYDEMSYEYIKYTLESETGYDTEEACLAACIACSGSSPTAASVTISGLLTGGPFTPCSYWNGTWEIPLTQCGGSLSGAGGNSNLVLTIGGSRRLTISSWCANAQRDLFYLAGDVPFDCIGTFELSPSGNPKSVGATCSVTLS